MEYLRGGSSIHAYGAVCDEDFTAALVEGKSWSTSGNLH